MDGKGDPSSPGLLGSLRGLADSALEALEVRLALLGNELEEQKVRIVEGAVMAVLGAMLLAVAALLLCVFVLLVFWDSYRLAAFGVMVVVAAGGGWWLVRTGRERLRTTGAMFQASIDELRQDREVLGREVQGASKPSGQARP